jgi:hypothetical protein
LKSKYFIIYIINNNVYGGNKNMKTNIILIALFVPAFMFLSNGSVDTANAETDISHCANLEATVARPACEAAAHVKSDRPSFDDTLMGVRGTTANRRYGTSYRNDLSEKNRMRNGIPASGLGNSSNASSIQMGADSNENRRYGTSYRNDLSDKNRMRNGIPGSGRKMN